MAKVSRQEREEIAQRRVVSILKTQGVVTSRTLEHKIADAGPGHMRVQPHILTPVRQLLVKQGRIVPTIADNAQWLHLSDENPDRVAARLQELTAIWGEFTDRLVRGRMGDALEIAVFRAMVEAEKVVPLNGFHDLNAPNERGRYSKQEQQTFNGRSLGKEALDFIALAGGEYAGIEVKNIREWLYPNRAEIKDAIRKGLTLGVIPVIIARRIPFVSFRSLGPCGVIMHENYNQIMSDWDAEIAAKAAHKNALGYHDLRVGNMPDARMSKFIGETMPTLLAEARPKIEANIKPLERFANNEIDFQEFFAITSGKMPDAGWRDDLYQ